MIYISSSCVSGDTIRYSVEKLVDIGFKNIELSGGTRYYAHIEDDLQELKAKFSLNYICHNYFPPPATPVVINLASSDPKVVQGSMEIIKNAITLSKVLGSGKYGFHAGYLIQIETDELGKSIPQKELFNREKAAEQFIRNFNAVKKGAGKLQLYLENNVVSKKNLENFEGKNPCFITDYEGYEYFKTKIDFKILLDVAHLKVSCNSFGLDFDKQLGKLITQTDYVHVSDNDGESDTNKCFKKDALYESMQKHDLKGKTFSLEVYSGIKDMIVSYENLQDLTGL